ncbi:MAG TPA: nucleotide exchange factor GrpE [Bacteroidetes bacterium]|nr:nucleotide exchange factor GrpE [Bacteroidota bacterium]
MKKEKVEKPSNKTKPNSRTGKRIQSKLKKLNEELKDCQLQYDDLNEKYLRLLADFDNYKKNAIKQRQETIKLANKDIVMSLLSVLDDMERSNKTIDEAKELSGIKEGLGLVFKKLQDTLLLKGLKSMDSNGDDFDPDIHEALCKVPSPSKDQKGKVVDVIEKGYYLNELIIRHAKVVVGE